MFDLLFERTADAVWLFNPATASVVDCNAAAVELMRFPSKSDLVGKHSAEISPAIQPDGLPTVESAAGRIREVLQSGNSRFEWVFLRYDGTEVPLEMTATAIERNGQPLIMVVSRDITERKKAEQEIRMLNASLEKRVAERTAELLRTNEQLMRTEQELRRRNEHVQKHRDVLLELAQSDKSDPNLALQQICSLAATTLEVARVSYWSLEEHDSVIVCELLHLRSTGKIDPSFRGVQLTARECPAYFEALATRRPIIASDAISHPATRGLGESYLKPTGIASMLDAPVWVRGEVVGVLCHEHIGSAREWLAEEVDFVSALATMVSLALEESQRARSESLLRESEEKYRALFEGTVQPVLLHDESGILEANPSWFKLLGYSRLEDVIGKHPAELSAPLQAGGQSAEALSRQHIAEALANGSARFEWLMLRRDGSELPIEVFLTPIYLSGRRVLQAVCNDITQRKRTEAELLRTLAREKELGQLRSNFISMVSHEFRTPLGIIQSSAEILEDYLEQLDPAERREHLQSIRKNTHRMAGLMEETLLIGLFEAGKMEYNPSLINLRTFLRKLVKEVLSATGRRCPIELALDGIPRDAKADERLLRHIFTNLLVNAAKYSDAGRQVWFEVRRDGANAVCVIRDQGIGIPLADREWLFNAFHRGRNVGDRPGTGLGLVIVKRCIDLHGGKIKVETAVGEGTVMTVRLPVFEEANESIH